MPKVLLLDLGRVVFGLDWKRPLKSLGLSETVKEKLLISGIQTWPPYDRLERGDCGFSEFAAACNEYLGRSFSELEVSQAWLEVLTGWEPGVEAALQSLKGKLPLFALTNTTLIHYEHMIRTYNPMRYFEKIFTSFEIGHRKPEKEIFDAVVAGIGVPARDILFIDDTEMHVEGAKRAGLEAVQLKEGVLLPQLLREYKIS